MKVPFEEVPELVAGRRVYVHKGYAYVAMNQVNFIGDYPIFFLICYGLCCDDPYLFLRLFHLLSHNFVAIYQKL